MFGLDLSPILAFVTLDLLGKSAVSLAAEQRKEGRGDDYGRDDGGVFGEMKKKGVFGVAIERGQ